MSLFLIARLTSATIYNLGAKRSLGNSFVEIQDLNLSEVLVFTNRLHTDEGGDLSG